ncbi:MAG: ABC transporter ATP-binding protein [Clostridia bacterium]|nr:ABC transporter ATP-binding protein [Clostridia bacterium]
MEAIQINGLTKRYKDTVAVNGLSLCVHQGELFSLLGVNGAGKTTAIKMLACLTRPDGGDALLMGHSIITQPASVKALIGLSPQNTAVGPNLTVQENLALMCGIYGYDANKRAEKTEELVRTFHLESVLHKRAGKLSGGWQRRLSIAMALVGEPQVLFLDEPTLGLDVIARSELWDTIRTLKNKATIILTTHYMEEAEALSDRIGIMKAGRLIALGTAQALKEKAGADTFESAFIALVKEG